MSNNLHQLADSAAEHNARRHALIAHARHNGTALDRIDAAFIPVLGADGFGQSPLDFDGSDEVTAIQKPMIARVQKLTGYTWGVAYEMTRWAAFMEWDAARSQELAA